MYYFGVIRAYCCRGRKGLAEKKTYTQFLSDIKVIIMPTYSFTACKFLNTLSANIFI
jgi:hypothetical protein